MLRSKSSPPSHDTRASRRYGMASARREAQPKRSSHRAQAIAPALAQPTRQGVQALRSSPTKQPQRWRTLSTSLGNKEATSSEFYELAIRCFLVPALQASHEPA